MDYQKKLHKELRKELYLALLVPLLLSSIATFTLLELGTSSLISCIIGASLALVGSLIAIHVAVNRIHKPINIIADAISYASNKSTTATAPNTEQSMIGRELITGLTLQIYNLASSTHVQDDIVNSSVGHSEEVSHHGDSDNIAAEILNNTPTPLVGIRDDLTIQNANNAFLKFIGHETKDILGKNFYDTVSLDFPGDDTLETWIQRQQESSVVATNTWERVRLSKDGEVLKQFDMVVGYSSSNSTGTDLILSFFDRTDLYNQDDREVSFVALAVHELRTPLTIMRGYIEVFEDEVGPHLNAEMQDFLKKMQASAQQLTAFVGNILNVARVEEDQLALRLRQEDLPSILQSAISDLQLRANVHGKTIELQNGTGLPPVGADRISIHEVVNNLVDNAIKYSGESEKISIRSFLNDEGLVQVDIQDYGIGIPASVMPQLFQKYHRSHKSKVQVGGTGLGLYLCKALITAHSGNIWVRSKEGEGAIFSFTLLPYDQISHEAESGEDGIIRGAHGWIKNHSLYRN